MSISEMIGDIDLSGQVAIVTGGGRGLGRVYAQWLAKAGAAVAVMARTASELDETVALIEKAGGRAIALPADVTDAEAVERVVAEVEEQLGLVDVLVNNAGVAGPVGPIWQNDAVEWWQCMEINLRGPFLCSRAVLPGMIARRQGRIINASSGVGNSGGPYLSAYCISKGALTRFTETLAAETKEYGISVFAIGPGHVRTAMTEAGAGSPEDEKWFGGYWARSFAEGRDNPPERGAELVLFLASGRADALSGCYFHVRYDVAEMVLRAEEIKEGELYTLRLRT